jgi:hypothetical protein
MAATCEISGNSDMYGLGIRIGFYLQWLSSPVSAWIAEKETSSLRSANALFKTATFIGLIIETVLNHLDVVEIYIILLLGFGTQYYRLIVMLWRIVTHFNAKWDPTRFMRMPTPSKMFWFSNSHLQVAQIIFQLWFWIYKIPRTENKCQRFGFALFRIGLTSSGFRILNIILMVALLVLTVIFFALHLRQLWQRHELPRFFKARCLTRSVVADSLETDSEDEDRATQATDDSSRRDPETERTPRRILTYGGDDTEEIETGEDVFVPSLRVPSLRVTSLRGEDEYEEKQDRQYEPLSSFRIVLTGRTVMSQRNKRKPSASLRRHSDLHQLPS